jgi:hypothetical protein
MTLKTKLVWGAIASISQVLAIIAGLGFTVVAFYQGEWKHDYAGATYSLTWAVLAAVVSKK